jgi:hypothetical protein
MPWWPDLALALPAARTPPKTRPRRRALLSTRCASVPELMIWAAAFDRHQAWAR